ncbi:MAG TPA: BACON domain-containing protein, partial [Smithellaceae bacterium]|nr:BACON domain-containing protein [Smithellaceae bacterium]
RSRSANGGTYNWMEDGQYHRVRIEALRTSSSQTYQVKAWVDCEESASPYTACPASEYIYFQDVYSPYNNSSYPPKINRTQQLSSTLNSLFDQILFGFTEGTGGSTQHISISNFAIYFPAYSISPAGESFTGGANTGTINVITAASSCTWTAVSNNTSWLTITSGASGTGNGIVSYSLAANTGAARTGTITISGQLFTVTQAGCTYTVGTPSSLSFASGGGSGTVSVTASAGCSWTTSNNGNTWITITPASGTGTGAAQTVNYTVAAGTGAPRTGTMTIAGQTFTVTQAGCTLTIADNSFACKSSTASNRVYIKVFLTDGAGGPVTDATVTYSVSGGGGSGTLTNNGGGWYGGTRTSNCGLGGDCARTGNLSGSRTVTVTATRAGCAGSPLTKTMTVP